jgi:hypothetical protein
MKGFDAKNARFPMADLEAAEPPWFRDPRERYLQENRTGKFSPASDIQTVGCVLWLTASRKTTGLSQNSGSNPK